MKHFLLEGEHTLPFEHIDESLITQHHQFLQQGYDQGYFLFSGPQVPAHGGFLVARAPSREALDQLLAEEPFVRNGVLKFIRITEFNAAQCHPLLQAWFS
jgi:uncharacterized protein YciI